MCVCVSAIQWLLIATDDSNGDSVDIDSFLTVKNGSHLTLILWFKFSDSLLYYFVYSAACHNYLAFAYSCIQSTWCHFAHIVTLTWFWSHGQHQLEWCKWTRPCVDHRLVTITFFAVACCQKLYSCLHKSCDSWLLTRIHRHFLHLLSPLMPLPDPMAYQARTCNSVEACCGDAGTRLLQCSTSQSAIAECRITTTASTELTGSLGFWAEHSWTCHAVATTVRWQFQFNLCTVMPLVVHSLCPAHLAGIAESVGACQAHSSF